MKVLAPHSINNILTIWLKCYFVTLMILENDIMASYPLKINNKNYTREADRPCR